MWNIFVRHIAVYLRRHSIEAEAYNEPAETYDHHFDLYSSFESCGYICC